MNSSNDKVRKLIHDHYRNKTIFGDTMFACRARAFFNLKITDLQGAYDYFNSLPSHLTSTQMLEAVREKFSV